jgi:hypothetical protein
MMLSRRLQETPGRVVWYPGNFIAPSTGSNYSGHRCKEQGKKGSVVRFSEQLLDFTTVYREQNIPGIIPADRF